MFEKVQKHDGQMVHLGDNVLCAFSIDTTGPKAGFHDIIQISVILLDYQIKLSKKVLPFFIDIKPKRPNNVDLESMKRNKLDLNEVILKGFEAYYAADLFETWFKKLNLKDDKKIIPLAYDWIFIREFLIDWLNIEAFNNMIDWRYRDVMVAANTINDKDYIHNNRIPFHRLELGALATELKIDRDKIRDSLQDTIMVTDIYRTLLSREI